MEKKEDMENNGNLLGKSIVVIRNLKYNCVVFLKRCWRFSFEKHTIHK
jgi:hypothetical protein